MGAWIEIVFMLVEVLEPKSLLSWERGLKYLQRVKKVNGMESLLSWERGLKYLKGKSGIKRMLQVAPLVGAWIEIWI